MNGASRRRMTLISSTSWLARQPAGEVEHRPDRPADAEGVQEQDVHRGALPRRRRAARPGADREGQHAHGGAPQPRAARRRLGPGALGPRLALGSVRRRGRGRPRRPPAGRSRAHAEVVLRRPVGVEGAQDARRLRAPPRVAQDGRLVRHVVALGADAQPPAARLRGQEEVPGLRPRRRARAPAGRAPRGRRRRPRRSPRRAPRAWRAARTRAPRSPRRRAAARRARACAPRPARGRPARARTGRARPGRGCRGPSAGSAPGRRSRRARRPRAAAAACPRPRAARATPARPRPRRGSARPRPAPAAPAARAGRGRASRRSCRRPRRSAARGARRPSGASRSTRFASPAIGRPGRRAALDRQPGRAVEPDVPQHDPPTASLALPPQGHAVSVSS